MIHVAQYLSPGERASAQTEREFEGLLDLVQPGWRESLLYRRFLPDMVVMNAIPLARCGGTRGRPGPEVRDVPGLYVAGDWVGKEALLADAALTSAKQAADVITASRSPAFAAAV